MSILKRFGKARKGAGKKAKQAAADEPVGLLVRLPLYSAAGGLLCVYAWGATETFPKAVGIALAAVFAMSELLKPKLGELVVEAMEATDRLATRLLLGASAACIALGAMGGVIAMEAANGPQERYDEAQTALTRAQARLEEAQRSLDGIPTCTPDMPRVRCVEQTERNATTWGDRTETRDEAKGERDEAKRAADRIPNPGPGIPHIEVWQKALAIGGIEFVMFAVPFAARRRGTRSTTPAVPRATNEAAPVERPAKINNGGWKRRRELYGPSGRKRGCQLAAVAT